MVHRHKLRQLRKKELNEQSAFFGANRNFFPKTGIQPKLTIGSPGDKMEKQADSVADRVISRSAANESGRNAEIHRAEEEEAQTKRDIRLQEEEEEMIQMKIQRQEEEEAQAKREVRRQEEEEEMVQPKIMKQEEEEAQTKSELRRQAEEEEEEIQTRLFRQEEEEAAQTKIQAKESKAGSSHSKDNIQNKGSSVSQAPAEFEQALKPAFSGGSPLPDDIRNEMEQEFGAGFKRVRIHTGTKAEALCSSISAQAFTYRNHIFFNKGRYSTATREGMHLLAHELTHVVQQRKK